MNRKQKKYTMCDTYLQWREHVDKNIEKYALDNENYKHWITSLDKGTQLFVVCDG